MKILFVYFDFMKGAQGKYYEGIASISAVLKQHNHSTRLFHITDYITIDQFMDTYEAEHSDSEIVAFSATTNAFYYIPDYARQLKTQFSDVITICGGTHATLCPQEVIQHQAIDIVCIGEGEYPMLDLCSRLESDDDITNIENLWVKKDGQVFKNSLRPIIRDLDTLPAPDRELFDFEHSMDKQMNRISFMGSRGCPFGCTYCCNHALRKLFSGSVPYVRFKSVDRLISEIKSCLGKYGNIEKIHLQDDILTLKSDWFREFTSRYKEQIGFAYVCNSRFDLLNEELIELLHDSGCVRVGLGLESGDNHIRNEILKRNQTKTQILTVSRLLHEKGMKMSLYTMVGIPFEDLSAVLNTVKLTAEINPHNIQTSIYYPYVKTELYDLCEEKGFLTGKRLDSYFEADTTLNLPDFPQDSILFVYQNFDDFVAYYIAAAKYSKTMGRYVGKNYRFHVVSSENISLP